MADFQEITDLPEEKLEKGFYYHYKHDPSGSINNYAYEVMGVSKHTEYGTYSMVYRPLYENTYLDADFSNRPLVMSTGTVEVEGKTVPRFSKITNQDVIDKLIQIRDEKYGS